MSRMIFIQADSCTLNPTLERADIDAEYASDPAVARSEWGGLFRDDISSFLTDDLIDAALPGRLKRGRPRPPVAFADMSGGVSDASVLAIAHAEELAAAAYGERPPPPIVVLDLLRCRTAPHEPDQVTEEFAKALKDFGLARVVGDRYAAGWCEGAFQKRGIRYEASELDKSQLYNEVLPFFAERRVELINDKRLITELRLLERRPRAGGRADAIDHAPRAHDDCANAACGALYMAARKRGITIPADLLQHVEVLPGSATWNRRMGGG